MKYSAVHNSWDESLFQDLIYLKAQLIFMGMKQEKNHYRVRSVTPTNFLSFDSFDMESKVKSVFPGSKSL